MLSLVKINTRGVGDRASSSLRTIGGPAEADGSAEAAGPAEAGGLLAEAGGPAEAGGLVAEAEGWSSAEAGGRGLAEAAGVAEADWVVTVATEEVLMARVLVSTSSPADAPQRRHYKA